VDYFNPVVDSISQEEIPNVDVFGSLGGRFTVVYELDGRHVILVDSYSLNWNVEFF
jgi:hypothetical protein